MSNLANPVECREWIQSWRADGEPERCERVFKRALQEQSTNLANIKASAWERRFLESRGIDVRAYERSVAMLQRAVDSGHYQ